MAILAMRFANGRRHGRPGYCVSHGLRSPCHGRSWHGHPGHAFRQWASARKTRILRQSRAEKPVPRPLVAWPSWPCVSPMGVGTEDPDTASVRSEEHTSELPSLTNLVCRLLLEKINK